MKKTIILCFLMFVSMMTSTIQASALPEKNELKPRLVVCTDIAPADVEPDDMESMVRLMAYADMFEIEATMVSPLSAHQ